jgi:hypothetical protein
MQEDLIVQNLEQLFSDSSFVVQVIQDDTELHVYINREPNCAIDQLALQQQIYQTVTALPIPDIQGIWLYSRILGMVDPDWQTYIALPQSPDPLISESLPELNSTPQASPLPVVEPGTTELPVEQTASSDSAVVESTSEVESEVESKSEAIAPQTQQTTPESRSSQFSQYCFIRNRLMLTADLVPPSHELARLIQRFHQQSEAEKQVVLPNLDRFFRTGTTPDLSSLNPQLQEWFNDLTALPSMEQRKATIWFSRYCFDPEATLMIVSRVLEPIAAPAEESESEGSKPAAPEQPAVLSNSDVNSPQVTSNKAASRNSAPAQLSSHSQPVPKHQPTTPTASRKKTKAIRITPWRAALGLSVMTLLMLIVVNQLTAPPSIDKICANSASPYCSLTVELVGPSVLQKTMKETAALTEEMTMQGENICQDVVASWMDRHSLPISTATVEMQSEEVFPGILLVDVQVQGVVAPPEDLPPRTACVFGQAKGELEWIANDAIPMDWPLTAYEGEAIAETMHRSATIYNILMILGANTLFTAVGLFVISMLGLSVQIYSIEALFQAAWLLGTVETCLFFALPAFGFFGGIALESLAFLATGACVKEFKVDWHAGYRSVALGVLVFMIIRWILHLILMMLLQVIV